MTKSEPPSKIQIDEKTQEVRYQIAFEKLSQAKVLSTPDEVLNEMQQLEPNAQVILLTGWGSLDSLDIIRKGALKYLEKPHSLDELITKWQTTLEDILPTREFVLISKQDYRITPPFLCNVLSPYLQAINDIQQTISDLKGYQKHPLVISEIRQKSPISVSLDGASDAIEMVREMVTPWRRKHAEVMAQLDEQEKMAEVETKRAEVLEKRTLSAKNRAETEKLKMESEKQRVELEKMNLENEKIRLALYNEKISFTLEVLKKVAPNLSEEEKIGYLLKLMQPIDVVLSSSLEVSDSAG